MKTELHTDSPNPGTGCPPRDSLVLWVLQWIAAESDVQHPLDIMLDAAETAVTLAISGGDARKEATERGWCPDDQDAAWIEDLAGELRAHLTSSQTLSGAADQ